MRFVTEATGPAFATREAALDAYAGRLDDPRPGHGVTVAPEDRYCALAERIEGAATPAPVEPTFAARPALAEDRRRGRPGPSSG